MEKILLQCASVITCLFLFSCICQVDVPLRTVAPELVVEGLISTGPPPYTIKLSSSGPYTSTTEAGKDSQYFITDARVTIEDDLGDSTSCDWTGLGNYQSVDSNFIGTVGRTYTLKIYLSNGKKYLSRPETITPVAPIDSLTVGYDSAQTASISPPPLIVTVNSHDPGAGQHFYRWASSGYVPRKSAGYTCGNNSVDCPDPYSCSCRALCEQFSADNQINILSNQYIEGGEIVLPVYYSPVYWFGTHFVEVNQYSLSLASYQFWEQYLEQTNRTGSILDPLPSSLIGNMYNPADSTEIVLGLFSASAVYTKKVIIVPFFLQQYLLESLAGYYIKRHDCKDVYPGALPDDTNPPGWENTQEIDLH